VEDFDLLRFNSSLIIHQSSLGFTMLPPFLPAKTRVGRRHADAVQAPPPPAAPRVLAVLVDDSNGTLEVDFDREVTWDGVGHGTFNTSTGGGAWGMQIAPTVLQLVPDCGTIFTHGATWAWDSPDDSLSPIPDPAQSGTCI
jgi:hypothetical protein